MTDASTALAQQAAPGANGACGSGDFRGWRHDSAGGGILDTPYAMRTYVGYGFYASGISANDAISSVRNRFNVYDVRLYLHSGYDGTPSMCFDRQMSSYRDIHETYMNDESSSHKGVHSDSC